MIEIKNLRKVFDNKFEALKSINVKIEDGELVCLLGPSGCGKTTILNLVAGLLDPTEGDILFDGHSVINLHPKDRGIGLVFQNYALYPHMTVLENIMFPLTVGKNKMPKDKAIQIARKHMKITNIEELEDKNPGTMSGVQQQRGAITRALVQNPKVLLLDEPLSNLDARLRLIIREEIRLVACGENNETKDESKTETNVESSTESNEESNSELKEETGKLEDATIVFWHVMNGAQEKALTKMTEDFMKKYPNVKVELQNQT